jgi:hypothetical protein
MSLKEIKECCSSIDDNTAVFAIQNEHFDCFENLINVGSHLIPKFICDVAIEKNNLKILEWLYEKGFECSAWTFYTAVKEGNLDILKWLKEKNCPWDKHNSCITSIIHGHFEIMEWLFDNGCNFNEEMCGAAAMCGNLNFLKWLREKKCPWDEKTSKFAIYEGHLDILEWINNEKCPFPEDACELAVLKEQIKSLNFLLKKKFPLRNVLIKTLHWKRFDCLEFLLLKKCSFDNEFLNSLKFHWDNFQFEIESYPEIKKFCKNHFENKLFSDTKLNVSNSEIKKNLFFEKTKSLEF